MLDNARLIEPSLLTTMVRALERIGVLVLIQPVAIAGWNIAKPENRRLDF